MFKTISENTCPLNAIAAMGEEAKNARIYLGKKAVEKLRSTADTDHLYGKFPGVIYELFWKGTNEQSPTLMRLIPIYDDFFLLLDIEENNIRVNRDPQKPERIIFLEMEE